MGASEYEHRYLQNVSEVLSKLDHEKIHEAVNMFAEACHGGKTIFACGNGGSSCIATEMVGELNKCCSLGREKRFKAICLSDNVASLTALANDEGYDTVFVEPLKNFAQTGDVFLGISGSGNSRNVLEAMRYANEIGCHTIALTSSEQGELRHLAEVTLGASSTHMGHLEDAFFVITHILCYAFIDGGRS